VQGDRDRQQQPKSHFARRVATPIPIPSGMLCTTTIDRRDADSLQSRSCHCRAAMIRALTAKNAAPATMPPTTSTALPPAQRLVREREHRGRQHHPAGETGRQPRPPRRAAVDDGKRENAESSRDVRRRRDEEELAEITIGLMADGYG